MKDNKNKNKIIGISIGILIVLLVVISSTYAYWQITRSQKDPNSIVAACLDFNVDFPVGINEDNAWPISNAEGIRQDGYTFTVTNNCETDVSYVVGLESVTSDGISEYLKDESIALAFDKEYLGTYGSLTNLQGPSTDARGSKELRTSTVKGKSEVEGENVNTHNLKVWIDENSDVTEQGRGFAAKLFITGGQGVENDNPVVSPTADACFEMDGNEIIGYDESCGKSVIIPMSVNGTIVKSIDSDAFKNEVNETELIYFDSQFNEVESLDTSTASHSFVVSNYEIGNDIDVTKMEYAVMYVDNEITASLESQLVEMEEQLQRDIPLYKLSDGDTEPDLKLGQIKLYQVPEEDGDMQNIGAVFLSGTSSIELSVTNLDLSQALGLEIVEPGAFSLVELVETDYNGCTDMTSAQGVITDVNSIPKGLTSLKFGEQEEIKIGYAAFAGLETDKLDIYTNVKAYSNCTTGITTQKSTSLPFVGISVDELNLYPAGSNGVFDVGSFAAPFAYSKLNNINIKDGITELTIISFSTIHYNTLTLPNTLETIGERAFGSWKYGTVPSSVVIPNSVTRIGEDAFTYWPETSTIEFLKTQEEVNNTVTFENASSWSGSATVKYAE